MKKTERKKHTIIRDDGVAVDAYCHPDLEKAVMWERPDGGVSITPADPMHRLHGETEDEQIARIVGKPPIPHTRWQIVDFWAAGIGDRTFRNAWKFGDKKIDFDVAKCKEIAKKRCDQAKHAAIDAATSPEELRLILPQALK